MNTTRLDLHIHSALSPCASEEMRPPAVLLTAEQRGLQVVGIADHSTGRNGWAFFEAAAAFEVEVLAGLEIESSEGVHLLALFDNRHPLEDFEAAIATHLPGGRNRPDVLGPQFLLDEWGEVIGEEERLLITAVDLGLERLAEMIAAHEGLSIAAHVDRVANGLLPTLGFVPPHLPVDFLEVSWRMTRTEARRRWPELAKWPLVCSSDAHALDEIGQGNTLVAGDLGLGRGDGDGSSPLPLSLARGTDARSGEGDDNGTNLPHPYPSPSPAIRPRGQERGTDYGTLREWGAALAEALRRGAGASRGDGDA
ncbi:MAG: PHP domain-containing protein [Armatimonadetes bacterium]|nr:PHP domain-containing protein [Armatimonadota bacterium]